MNFSSTRIKKVLTAIFITFITLALVTSAIILLNRKFPIEVLDESKVSDGYTLFSPLFDTNTYLINNDGDVVKTWKSDYGPGNSVYLLPNGNLLRTAKVDQDTFTRGAGGRVEMFSWGGDLVWEFDYATDSYIQHHDIEPLPNGNILILAWDAKESAEAIANGMDSEYVKEDGIITDKIIEVNPETDEIVWEWDTWDHIVQDVDPAKPNFGVIAENPRKLNVNYFKYSRPVDWTHANSVDYNEEHDQIMISAREFNEIWIIDHNTTTDEAKGEAGDLLYRWGNSETYNQGTLEDRILYKQHDAEWVDKGLPGEGNVLIFSNGENAVKENSEVLEVKLPLNPSGGYSTEDNKFNDSEIVWSYGSKENERFYSHFISGAQRLQNGNTLITSGAEGVLFEVTEENQIVWKYNNPFNNFSPELEKDVKYIFRADKYSKDYEGFWDL
jgi:hypothetical protein